MSIVYNNWLLKQMDNTYRWDNSSVTFRAMLAADTTNYSPNKDHVTVNDVLTSGFVELNAAGYSRVTITNRGYQLDNTNDLVTFTCDDMYFGDIVEGHTVKGILIFVRTGSSDSNTDPVVAYIDQTTTGPLNMPTGNGPFVVKTGTTGVFKVQQGT